MKSFALVALFLGVAAASSIPVDVQVAVEGTLDERGNSGCYTFADPDCCIDQTVCQCANGWFYKLNADEDKLCQPPGAVLSKKGESHLPGFCC